jgi:hypothetical protein
MNKANTNYFHQLTLAFYTQWSWKFILLLVLTEKYHQDAVVHIVHHTLLKTIAWALTGPDIEFKILNLLAKIPVSNLLYYTKFS